MSVEIFSNEDGAVFICNTTEWAFGPKMPGANVAEAFLKTFVGTDPRRYTDSELSARWADFLTGKMICPYGHQDADVENYGDETIFSCMEKGCEAQWNLAGEEITEESEEEKRMNYAEAIHG